jgi:tripartite-type tricarboxylate transporter receptor subunit TctC
MAIVVRILFACGLALASAAAHISAAYAQGYPSKPITVIVPFGPGSATDTICRIVTQQLANNINASIIIENKVGANGAIAGAYVARSTPDGYTLLMATNSPLSAAPSLNKTMTYDPVKDFVGLSRVGSYTFTLAINKDVPAKTLGELIAYAKANPGKLSHASGNSSGLVAGETFKTAAGLDILHVPYRSAPPAMNDLLAGRVSMMFTDLTIGLPHVRSGALRALATTRLQRSTLLPDLPTLDEAGVKGFDMDSWAGLFAPAGTPPDVVAKLNAELRKVIDNPEIKAKIAVLGFEAFSSSTEDLNQHVKVQLVKWTKMIKDAGIEPE